MNVKNKIPESRFAYSTPLYTETIRFYKDVLQLEIYNSWDRGAYDRGTIFKSPNGTGLLEIEEGRIAPLITNASLYIEVENIDQFYEKAVQQGIQMIQPITNTSFGHRSFKFEDPNKLVIGFFEILSEIRD